MSKRAWIRRLSLAAAGLALAGATVAGAAPRAKKTAAPAPDATAPATAPATYPGMLKETSKVVTLHLAGFPAGSDLDVTLFARGGMFYSGYSLLVGQPQVPQKVVCQPAGPHGIFDAATGKEIDPPAVLFKRYGYKDPEFVDLRNLVQAGKVAVRRYDDPVPIAWMPDGKGLAGTFDVILTSTSKLEGEGTPYRVSLALAAAADGKLSGTYEAWAYGWNETKYGQNAQRTKGAATGQRRDDFWDVKPGMEIAKGHDWPQVHGPSGNMSATDTVGELVDDIRQAKLAWVSEEIMAGSKGDRNKTPFGMGPLVSNGMEGGGYASPAIVGDRLYLYYFLPDLSQLQSLPQWKQDILYLRGAPLGNDAMGHFVNVFVCIDARTGKMLWRVEKPFTSRNLPDEKQGRGLTPVICDGVMVTRSFAGLVALDAGTGKELWKKSGGGCGAGGTRVYWSCEESPVAIGGVVLLPMAEDAATTVVALDPKTGEELWRQPRVRGYNSVPQKVVIEGKEYIVSACGASLRSGSGGANAEMIKKYGGPEYNRLVLMEPRTGKVLWETHDVGPNANSVLVLHDIVCLNVNPASAEGAVEKAKAKPAEAPTADAGAAPAAKTLGKPGPNQEYPGAFRLSLTGATKLWENKNVHYQGHRNTPLAHKALFILDSRISGFQALDAATGQVRGASAHIYHQSGGDHNWTWCIASNNKVITSGLLLYQAEPELKRFPGQLPVPLAAGYGCPVKPAIAHGRLFIRTKHQLVCYDLRKAAAK